MPINFIPDKVQPSSKTGKVNFIPDEAQPETFNPMSALESAFSGFNTGAEKITHGILQPLVESGLLGNRVKQASQNVTQDREKELDYALRSSPNTAQIAEMAGGFAGSSPLMAIPGAGQNALLRALTQGIFQGTAMGAGQYVPGNDWSERGKNALIGGGIGGASYPVVRGLSAANPYVKAGTGAALATGAAKLSGRDDYESLGAAGAAGATLPFVPGMAINAVKNAGNKLKSLATGSEYQAARTPLQDVVSRNMLNQVDPAIAQQRLEAGRRLDPEWWMSPAEASGSPIAGAAEGGIGKTKEGGQELYNAKKERLNTEKRIIKDLYHDIYPKDQKLLEKEKELYARSADTQIETNKFNELTKDPVINDAIGKVITKTAFAKDLEGIPKNSIKYLDYTKKYIDDMISKAQRAGEKNEVRLLKESKDKLVDSLDKISTDYQQARQIAQRRLTRQEFEKALNDKDIRGTNFYQKLLKNDKKFEEMKAKVANIPGAQEKLDDMRLTFEHLINPVTARSAAGLAKTKMTSARSSLEGYMDKAKEMLGGHYDKAAVSFITSPKWDKEFAEIARLDNKEKKALRLTDLLAKISTSLGTQKMADR